MQSTTFTAGTLFLLLWPLMRTLQRGVIITIFNMGGSWFNWPNALSALFLGGVALAIAWPHRQEPRRFAGTVLLCTAILAPVLMAIVRMDMLRTPGVLLFLYWETLYWLIIASAVLGVSALLGRWKAEFSWQVPLPKEVIRK